MRIATGIVSAIVLVASAFLGLIIFLAVLGLLAVVGTIMAVKFWLFRRRIESTLKRGTAQPPRDSGYIDAEYEERDER